MGYEQGEMKIIASLSRHNSPRDSTDDALWWELTERINKIITEPKYEAISVSTVTRHPALDELIDRMRDDG